MLRMNGLRRAIGPMVLMCILGRAYLLGLCGEEKMSIVMDRFEVDTTTIAAHELGHK